jgi:hypothetical protein
MMMWENLGVTLEARHFSDGSFTNKVIFTTHTVYDYENHDSHDGFPERRNIITVENKEDAEYIVSLLLNKFPKNNPFDNNESAYLINESEITVKIFESDDEIIKYYQSLNKTPR